MSLKPTVTLHGALPVLQPEYYYSELFIRPLSLDLEKLLTVFVGHLQNGPDHYGTRGLPSNNTTDQNGRSGDKSSFEIFKVSWVASDWNFMHLRCLDAVGRVAFLQVLHRLFLGA